MLRRFDAKSREDCDYFFPFLKMFEDCLKEDGIVDRTLGWVDSIEDCARFYDMSAGILGTPCRVAFLALERAFRAGRTYLKWDDIEKSFRAFNALRPESERTFDPFTNGPQKETVAVLKSMLAKESK
jgi:hypothetical protein